MGKDPFGSNGSCVWLWIKKKKKKKVATCFITFLRGPWFGSWSWGWSINHGTQVRIFDHTTSSVPNFNSFIVLLHPILSLIIITSLKFYDQLGNDFQFVYNFASEKVRQKSWIRTWFQHEFFLFNSCDNIVTYAWLRTNSCVSLVSCCLIFKLKMLKQEYLEDK